MGLNDVIELADRKMHLAVNSYIISLIALVIILILFFFLIKAKGRGLTNNLRKIIPIILLSWVAIAPLVEGINANIISNQLKLDRQEMQIQSTSGEVVDFFSKAKTQYIVINQQSYICSEYQLNIDVSTGLSYNIKYLSHSKLIIDMEEVR